MKTPLIILSKDRPNQLIRMLESIVPYMDNIRLIVCDNASTDTGMMAAYEKIKDLGGILIKNGMEMGFYGFNPGLKLFGKSKYFFLSDPDIVLGGSMPKDWVDILASIMDHHAVPKIGPALSIKFSVSNRFTQRINHCEGKNWERPYIIDGVEDRCYCAPIDTTLAMYRRDTYTAWADSKPLFKPEMFSGVDQISQEIYNPKYDELFKMAPCFKTGCIRIAGRFTAEHTGWDVENKYTDENEYYYNRCNKVLASTIRWRKENRV